MPTHKAIIEVQSRLPYEQPAIRAETLNIWSAWLVLILGALLVFSMFCNVILFLKSVRMSRPLKLAPRPIVWEMPSNHWRN